MPHKASARVKTDRRDALPLARLARSGALPAVAVPQVAVTLVAALGDRTRCASPRELRQCLGLVPAASASGERRQQGAMTTAGHPQARKALVAGAWVYRSPAKGRRPRQRRRAKPPKILQAISGQAHVRRCKRYRQLVARGQHAHSVTVAMARERAGCLWAYRILCLRFAHLVRHACSPDSAMDARLDTGGWLALTRQGLSPCKRCQACLGARTPGLSCCRKRERRGGWRQSAPGPYR